MASILVIEDVPAVLLSLKIVLEGAGHRVTTAMDGTAGLAAIDRGNFDLVITDIWMPGTSGTRIVRKGREKLPNTRFLVITGGDPSSRAPEDGVRLESFGADELLLKPFEKDELIEAVSRLVDAAAC